MYLYLAASSLDIDRVEHWAKQLDIFNAQTAADWVLRGQAKTGWVPSIQITHNWWAEVKAVGEANPVNAEYHERVKWASADLRGVADCDLFWMFMPPEGKPSVGCWLELGYALASNKACIVTGPGQKTSIFTALTCSYDADESGWQYIQDTFWNELDTGYGPNR